MPTVEALQFHLRHIAGLETLLQQQHFDHLDQNVINMMLEQANRFSQTTLLPLAELGDRQGCQLNGDRVVLPEGSVAAYQQWCDLGFPALSIPQAQGGFGFPRVVQHAIQELQDGANLAFGMLCINQRCAATALLASASPDQIDTWLPVLTSGEWAATIAISEPQAGSDVGRIRTRAEFLGDGSWQLSGTKFWISYGDHDATDNILHLVLARTGESGTRGLSLFVVPRVLEGQPNGVQVLRLEEKMGLHASPTCVLELEGARGYLLGEPGRGLASLFPMMNAMRLAVSVQGSAVANAATQYALQYAGQRTQGGQPDKPAPAIAEHADVKRMLLEMTAKSELLRALSIRTAGYLDLADCLTGEDASQMRKRAELLLPVAKTISAEWSFDVANQGIQVLGGYGYTREFPLERMARDVRVASIYEGTSGIQALDFVKRKLLGDDLNSVRSLLQTIEKDLQQAEPSSPLYQPLSELLALYQQCLTALGDGHMDIQAGAYALLRLTGLLCCSWLGLELYSASINDSPYQTRLRQALKVFSVGLTAEAESWYAKATAQGLYAQCPLED